MKRSILAVAYFILEYCDGAWSRDKQGYDIFDAYTVRAILSPDIFGDTELSDEELEFLRQKLLRYRNQVRRLTKKYGSYNRKIEMLLSRLEQPVCSNSFICFVKMKDGREGRLSLKNLKKMFQSEVEQK